MAENLRLSENVPESLKDHEHLRYVDQMPLAVVNGYRPANMADVMGQRVVTSGNVQKNWQFNYFDTVDGCPTHPDGSFKVVLDCDLLMTVNPQTILVNGALPLEDKVYKSLQGVNFSKKDRARFTGKYLTEKQAKNNRVWLTLAREDQDLLNRNAEAVFKYLKDTHNLDVGMAVILADAQSAPELRAWCLSRFVDVRSGACGYCGFDDDGARLVRVGAGGAVTVPRSGAQKNNETSLDAKVSVALDSGKSFRHNGRLYVPVDESALVPQ
ncbi:hypothetical protein COV11_03880 [Candidatus Woesearchaeota archaeon CG10_big_fil_rev_8_21_14_0_10_30_7]|nr:MAG: hypothetical protein COV11_03880 [Candidatus Woesearchaeota archaeon CG10_big_fil_rev_8_21_14_0_10_30_7]